MTTPNMLLLLPDPDVTIGPLWAQELNDALDLVDAHDHTTNHGVKVPTAGLNINADLPINTHNITGILAARFVDQTVAPSGPSDLAEFTSINGDIWWINDAGTPVQITSGSSVVGTTGSITGLVPPASANYSSLTESFTFLKNTNKPGKLNISEISLYEFNNAAANPVTLASPASLVAPYKMFLPDALPANGPGLMVLNSDGTTDSVDVTAAGSSAYKIVKVNSAGDGFEIGFIESQQFDNNVVTTPTIANLAVTTAKIDNQAVTTAKIASGAIQNAQLATASVAYPNTIVRFAAAAPTAVGDILYSNSSGVVSGTFDSGPVSVNNLVGYVNVRATGLVRIEIVPDTSNSSSGILFGGSSANFRLYRDGSSVMSSGFSGNAQTIQHMMFVDNPISAGLHLYQLFVESSASLTIRNMRMIAYEI